MTVAVRNILEDTQNSSYITMISGDNNERYIVRTVVDMRKLPNVRTIVYKKVPGNNTALELFDWSRKGTGFIKTNSHEPVVSFIVQNFDNIDDAAKNLNIDFQETMC